MMWRRDFARAWALATVLLAQPCLAAPSLLPNGEQTFVDANGVPYSGGLVYFYIPNTLTPKTTWQDSAGTIPNTNPVVLNSAGRAVIWGMGAYRQILKDAAGNTIWDKTTQGGNTGAGSLTINTTILGPGAVATCSGVFPVNNTSGANMTLTMPTSPTDGDSCQFADVVGNWGTYSVTWNFGTKTLTSGGTTYLLGGIPGYGYSIIGFTWSSSLQKWIPG